MNKERVKKVYACFSTDVLHEGHINIINEAQKYGELTVGVLSDEACVKFDRFSTISLDEKIKMFEKIPGVSRVIIQKNTKMY